MNPTSSITYAIPAVVGGAAASEPSGATSVAIVATVSPIVATATSTIVEATPVSDDSDDSDDSSEDEAQVTNSPAVISQPAQTTFATVVSKAYTRNSNHRHHRHGSRTSKPTVSTNPTLSFLQPRNHLVWKHQTHTHRQATPA